MSRFSTAPSAPDRSLSRVALAASVIEGRTFRDVTIHGTPHRGRMRALTRAEVRQIRVDVRKALADLGIVGGLNEVEATAEWRAEHCLRTVALAVRDPAPGDSDPPPLAPLSEWEACNDIQLGALWDDYQDLLAQLDPYGSDAPLTDEEARRIEAEAKKGGLAELMQCGWHTLARFAITLVSRQAEPPST